jgi:hypothetical protein
VGQHCGADHREWQGKGLASPRLSLGPRRLFGSIDPEPKKSRKPPNRQQRNQALQCMQAEQFSHVECAVRMPVWSSEIVSIDCGFRESCPPKMTAKKRCTKAHRNSPGGCGVVETAINANPPPHAVASDFQENSFAIQHVHRRPAAHHIEQRIQQRRIRRAGQRREHMLVNKFLPAQA